MYEGWVQDRRRTDKGRMDKEWTEDDMEMEDEWTEDGHMMDSVVSEHALGGLLLIARAWCLLKMSLGCMLLPYVYCREYVLFNTSTVIVNFFFKWEGTTIFPNKLFLGRP